MRRERTEREGERCDEEKNEDGKVSGTGAAARRRDAGVYRGPHAAKLGSIPQTMDWPQPAGSPTTRRM